MTVQAAGERHKKNFEHYLDLVDRAEADGDLEALRYALGRAIECWISYAESAVSDIIKEARLENLQKLLDWYESLPEQGGRLPTRGDGAKKGARSSGPDSSRGSKAKEGSDEDDQKFLAVERPGLRFSDIAGLEEVKQEIRLKMLYPFQHPEEAARYRVKRGGGVLLWGPPGTGKTMMAKAIAGEIDAAFYTVKPSEIMSKWVGDSEQNVRALFEEARSHELSIIFIDEIEALIPARKGNETGGVMARLVPQILAELEGFDTATKNPLLFIGATNAPWSLDPAVLRPGRFDVKVYVGLPDLPARQKILELGFRERPLSPEVDLPELARGLEGYSGADLSSLCEKAASDAFLRAVHQLEGDKQITGADLDQSITETRPSVTPDDLERFLEYRERW
jgi:transitional endoplasmic reticulum ATPase